MMNHWSSTVNVHSLVTLNVYVTALPTLLLIVNHAFLKVQWSPTTLAAVVGAAVTARVVAYRVKRYVGSVTTAALLVGDQPSTFTVDGTRFLIKVVNAVNSYALVAAMAAQFNLAVWLFADFAVAATAMLFLIALVVRHLVHSLNANFN